MKFEVPNPRSLAQTLAGLPATASNSRGGDETSRWREAFNSILSKHFAPFLFSLLHLSSFWCHLHSACCWGIYVLTFIKGQASNWNYIHFLYEENTFVPSVLKVAEHLPSAAKPQLSFTLREVADTPHTVGCFPAGPMQRGARVIIKILISAVSNNFSPAFQRSWSHVSDRRLWAPDALVC